MRYTLLALGLLLPACTPAAHPGDAGGDAPALPDAAPIDAPSAPDAGRDASLPVEDTLSGSDGGDACGADDLGSALGVDLRTGSTATSDDLWVGMCSGSAEAGPAVRFSWTAPATTSFVLDTFGSAFDTQISLLEGGPCGVELACNDDEGAGAQSRLVLEAVAGTTYGILVTGYETAVGNYHLSISGWIDAETICADGEDDDRDGYTDCDDGDCTGTAACGERVCNDGSDDDGDTYADCDDRDCELDAACVGRERCENGVDDDGDGLVDCDDDGCTPHQACFVAPTCVGVLCGIGESCVLCPAPACVPTGTACE